MNTKACKQCMSEIHELARTCPHCRESQSLKDKYLPLFVLFILIVALMTMAKIPDFSLFNKSIKYIEDTSAISAKVLSIGFNSYHDKLRDRVISDIFIICELNNTSDSIMHNVDIKILFKNDNDQTIDMVNTSVSDLKPQETRIIKTNGRAIKPEVEYKKSIAVIQKAQIK